jgi:hypothetical protein
MLNRESAEGMGVSSRTGEEKAASHSEQASESIVSKGFEEGVGDDARGVGGEMVSVVTTAISRVDVGVGTSAVTAISGVGAEPQAVTETTNASVANANTAVLGPQRRVIMGITSPYSRSKPVPKQNSRLSVEDSTTGSRLTDTYVSPLIAHGMRQAGLKRRMASSARIIAQFGPGWK